MRRGRLPSATRSRRRQGWLEVRDSRTPTSITARSTHGRAPGYNTWPFGLENRTSGYTVGIEDEQLKKQLVSRPTTFLLSQVDTLPLGGFDSSCSAMAQGPTRRARGEAFVKYINETLGAKHPAMIVPECGHNDRCVYTTDGGAAGDFPEALSAQLGMTAGGRATNLVIGRAHRFLNERIRLSRS